MAHQSPGTIPGLELSGGIREYEGRILVYLPPWRDVSSCTVLAHCDGQACFESTYLDVRKYRSRNPGDPG